MRLSTIAAALALTVAFSTPTLAQEARTEPLGDFGKITELLFCRCVGQDEDGTIWFGTDKCLYSYDGYDLKSHPDGIGDKQYNSLVCSGGLIYLGCNDGYLIFDSGSGEYTGVEYFKDVIVRALYKHGDYIYIGGESGLYRYNTGEGVSSISKICDKNVYALEMDSGTFWIGTGTGLDRYDTRTRSYATTEGSLPWARMVTSLLKGSESTLWMGTNNAFYELDTDTMEARRITATRSTKTLCTDGQDGVYIGTDNGLMHYDRAEDKTFKASESVVWGSCTDKDGDFWFASENGLLISRQGTSLKTLPTGDAPDNALYSNILRDSKGRLWAGSTQGVLLLKGGSSSPYTLVERHYVEDRDHYLPHNKIKALIEDKHDGSIYVATDSGCLKYDEETGRFQSIKVSGLNNWMYDLLLDGNNLWIATFKGLFCISGGELLSHYDSGNGLSGDDIAQIAKDSRGNIWIRTRNQHIFTLGAKDKGISEYDLGAHAGSAFCSCVTSDMEGSVWMAAGNEIVYLNHFKESEEVRTIRLQAQKALEIYSMSDFRGRIWVCTSEGIHIIDKESLDVSHINSGMKYVTASYDGMSGNVLLGARGRIVSIPHDKIDEISSKHSRDVKITSVTVGGTRQVPNDDLKDGRITLPACDNNLVIAFSDFDYSREIPRRFHYSFKGRKDGWTEVLSGNKINLPNLHPGRYNLNISSGSLANERTAGALSIRIRNPWYLSVPMSLLYLLALAALAYWTLRFASVKRALSIEREQRDALLRQSKEKEAFFGNIAHEFKTPLSLVIAPLSKLVQEVQDPEEKEMIQIAHDNATKLNSLVHKTIDYYREDSGAPSDDLIRSEVEFVEFARAIFLSYKDNYPGLEFIFDASQNKIFADVDVAKMEIVLGNLLSNACKFTPEGGSVIMTLEKDDESNRLIIKISDTGIGIPEEELDLVFQRYYESSRTKDGGYDSTGIGLAIIKKHVESHGGTISASSDGNGTTFTAVMPCRREESPAEPPQTVEAVEDDDKPLVVIVDDNAQICSFLEKVLRKKYRCITTGNGKSGLKLCKDVMPDLIVTDVMMPVMDGLEMCRQIREFTPLSTIPIIMLTAKGDSETERKSIELNIDSFIPKPFEFGTLTAKIDQLIGNKRRMEQKIRLEMISVPDTERKASYDEKFLMKVTKMIEEKMEDSEFSVRSLCELGGYGEKQLYRKIKQLTGMSTVEYIRSIRLKKAALMFQTGNYTVSEVMYSVGFANASYFTRSFAAEYGRTPSEYIKMYKKNS